tara:strand:+ start:851 stop:1351 length:501 start_codon:yes stop_codon:yes gene_type:complete
LKNTHIYYLLFLNLFISATPIDEINTFFNHDLTFVQTSLNKIDSSFDKSVGSFKRGSDNIIRIDIESPFKEKYFLDRNGIEVHDIEFNQIRNIPIEEVNKNFFINFILNGFIDNSKILNLKKKSFIVVEDQKEFYFEFIDQNTLQIKFKDNMNIDNLIKFSKNNAN